MRDPEGEDEAVQRNRSARRNGGEEVSGARLPPPFPFLHALEAACVASLQCEDVLWPGDEALAVELVDPLPAQALDVERVARHKMLQPLPRLGRADQPARAAAHRVFLAGAGVDLSDCVAA